MFLWDSRQFFDKIRPGQFVGQNLNNHALITSWEKIYISKMVCESDLQSLPVVSIIFGDISWCLRYLSSDRSLHVLPKWLKPSKPSMSSKNKKFCSSGEVGRTWNFIFRKEGTLTDNICTILDTERLLPVHQS